jgi:hypothetical protein
MSQLLDLFNLVSVASTHFLFVYFDFINEGARWWGQDVFHTGSRVAWPFQNPSMPSAASHVSPSAHVPAAAASPLAAPVMHAAAALPAHPDTAAVIARMAVYLNQPPH